ncbi:MAG TPA: hypothetical protein PLE99_01520 [Candidatus Thiothrix moscowensis]|uniref:hypothetical protein n=1 Tax=unclassified Thiothrix TaxID=2636184 RepID=UPI0025EDB18E|nr:MULTISPECIES: hypothetical protein [unclassified Thiothrix]HRJ51416.1 hypothetical protein [Candidatus Thiothrix moscowensis]HRJ91529.1 hypothetical protein [Candidatus Thiothrix moscowensis]
MSATLLVKENEQSVQGYLQKLDLDVEILINVIERSHIDRMSADKDEPTTAPGTYAYFAIVRELRKALLPKGWEKGNLSGLETVFNPANNVSIIQAIGNRSTGTPTSPSTKNTKGKKTREYIQSNKQFSISEFDNNFSIKNSGDILFQTWVLLHYFDRSQQEIRFELSLPTKFESYDNGRIRASEWEIRLVFNPVKIANSHYLPEPPPNYTDPVNIAISKKL